MGTLISRFRKSKTTVEVLEEIDKSILHIEKFRRANQELRQKVIGKLILYSVIIYIAGAFSLYFFFMPQEWSYRIYGLLPFLFFPFLPVANFIDIHHYRFLMRLLQESLGGAHGFTDLVDICVYILKRALHWFFVRKISQNEEELQRLRDKRKDILENVMETETYKKAKEILEKFDPETKKKMEEEKKKEEEKQQPNPSTPPSGLRRRQVAGRSPQPGSPQSGNSQSSPSPMPEQGGSLRNGHPGPSQMPIVLPRPVLPLNKSNLDKIMDYMIGDGANQRYALICRHCANHNGMALKEEFQYLAFRCAYCRYFNPARKQRPNAPPLPASTPRRPSEASKPQSDSNSDGDDELNIPDTEGSAVQDAKEEASRDPVTSDEKGDNVRAESSES